MYGENSVYMVDSAKDLLPLNFGEKYPYKFNSIKTKFLQEQSDTIAHPLA